MAGRKGVFFDTSTWSPIDLLDFYRQSRPSRCSTPATTRTASSPASLLIALKTARCAGYSTRSRSARMLAGNANALADGDDAARADGAAGRATRSRSRCSSRASTSTSRWRRRCSGRASRTRSASSGSRSTPARERNGHADEVDRHPRAARGRARRSGATLPDARGRGGAARRRSGSTHRLIHLADIEAVTAWCLSCDVNGGTCTQRRSRRVGTTLAEALRDELGAHRHEDRLRRGPLRRVHGAPRRHAGALVHHARAPRRRRAR